MRRALSFIAVPPIMGYITDIEAKIHALVLLSTCEISM
jgi:hypothetical protein